MKAVYSDGDNKDKTQTELEAYIEGCRDTLEAVESLAMEEDTGSDDSEVAKYVEECKEALESIKNKDEGDAYFNYSKEVRKEVMELLNNIANNSETHNK